MNSLPEHLCQLDFNGSVSETANKVILHLHTFNCTSFIDAISKQGNEHASKRGIPYRLSSLKSVDESYSAHTVKSSLISGYTYGN